mgnify:CR=1 FL=1
MAHVLSSRMSTPALGWSRLGAPKMARLREWSYNIEEKIQKFDYKRSDSSVTIGLDGFDLLYCRNMT